LVISGKEIGKAFFFKNNLTVKKVDYIKICMPISETIEVVPKKYNPPNKPQVRPIKKLWAMFQQLPGQEYRLLDCKDQHLAPNY
jgi:hypothetical protein